MASGGMAPAIVVGKPAGDAMIVDTLPEEINEMKIRDEKVEKVSFSNIHKWFFFLMFSFLFPSYMQFSYW